MISESREQVWVRLPNWLGDVVMAVPVLRALHDPERVELTLVGKSAFLPAIERLQLADRVVALPPKKRGYFSAFRTMCTPRPHRYLVLTRSLRGDLEARLSGARTRLGLSRTREWRPLLTRTHRIPPNTDRQKVHQTALWGEMMTDFGWTTPMSFAPIELSSAPRHPNRIGLICGSENSPEKRWPVPRWRAMIDQLLASDPNLQIRLYGTPGDAAVTQRVAEGFDPVRVRDLAGQTDLPTFCEELAACAVVCANDTGGMHLANMLGTPLVALFGPTNPVRTGPVFESQYVVLQPPGCPTTGGTPIEKLPSDQATDAVSGLLGQRG
ncbi:MAG: glycosyltransferase family 9 protein [Pseudomonadota bacterium]